MEFLRAVDIPFRLAMMACPLHFLMIFPKPKRFVEPAGREKWIYMPVALLALLAAVAWFPNAKNEALWAILGPSMSALYLGYPVLILVTLIHTSVTASRNEWQRQASWLPVLRMKLIIRFRELWPVWLPLKFD